MMSTSIPRVRKLSSTAVLAVMVPFWGGVAQAAGLPVCERMREEAVANQLVQAPASNTTIQCTGNSSSQIERTKFSVPNSSGVLENFEVEMIATGTTTITAIVSFYHKGFLVSTSSFAGTSQSTVLSAYGRSLGDRLSDVMGHATAGLVQNLDVSAPGRCSAAPEDPPGPVDKIREQLKCAGIAVGSCLSLNPFVCAVGSGLGFLCYIAVDAACAKEPGNCGPQQPEP